MDSYTQISLTDVSLGEGTTIEFFLSSKAGVTEESTWKLIDADHYYIADINTITFNLSRTAGSIWKDGQEYALEWDLSTFADDGTLRVKQGEKIPEPTSAALSPLGLSALLLRRRRI